MSDLLFHSISQFFYSKKLYLFSKLFYRMNCLINSCDIPSSANIHSTVSFPHRGLGVVIGHDTVIGANTKIGTCVTIGGRKGIRANPNIGENCIIGSGAKILGPVRIGNNCKIGANAVVITDVPDDCTAVGVPAKIIYNK